MKGTEFKMILGLIILIAVIVLIVILVINPGFLFGKQSETQISFREFCVFWSLNGYDEGDGEMVERDSKIYGCPSGCNSLAPPFFPKNYCPDALGKPLQTTLSEEEVEQCRNVCRLKA